MLGDGLETHGVGLGVAIDAVGLYSVVVEAVLVIEELRLALDLGLWK